MSVVVRAWGEPGLTHACLESIWKNTNIDWQGGPSTYEIILVDQGAKWVFANVNRMRDVDFVVCPSENLGAVTATNLGLQIAMTRPSDLILVMDNDTRVPEGDVGWLERWVHHFDDEEVGAVGATTDYVSGLQRIQDVPRTHTKAVDSDKPGERTFTGPIYAPWLISFACMYRKKALLSMPAARLGIEAMQSPGSVLPDGTFNQELDDWQQAHLWDERFNPGNWEDIDVSIRMQSRGWKLSVARDVYIHHRGSMTFKKGDFNALLEANRAKGREKWGEDVLAQLRIERRAG